MNKAHINKLLYRITRRLPPRIWYFRGKQPQHNASGFGFQQHIVARSLCLYRCFDLQETPKNLWNDILHLKISQWSPWTDTGQWIHYQGQQAMVWIWDQGSINREKAQIFPESVLHKKSTEDGVYTCKLQEGHELQHWHKGVLLQSYWQSQPFRTIQQERFLARCPNLQTDTVIAAKTGVLPFPILNEDSRKQFGNQGNIKQIAMAVAVLFLSLYAILGTHFYQLKQHQKETQQEYEQLMQQLQPLMQERQGYRQAQTTLQAMQTLLPESWQSHLMLMISDALIQAHCKPCLVDTWIFEGKRIEFQVQAEKLLVKKLVEALDKTQRFNDITTRYDDKKNLLNVKMRLVTPIDKVPGKG